MKKYLVFIGFYVLGLMSNGTMLAQSNASTKPHNKDDQMSVFVDSTMEDFKYLIWDMSNVKNVAIDKEKNRTILFRKDKYPIVFLDLYLDNEIIKGNNLSKDIRYYINGQEVTRDMIDLYRIELSSSIHIQVSYGVETEVMEDNSINASQVIQEIWIGK